MKKCSGCQKELDESNFYKGYRNCKVCHQKIVSKYQDNNKDKVALGNRKRKLFNRYGVTLEQYENMLKAQSGKCKLCGDTDSKNSNSKKLYVDHCHKEGVVRGLLCHKCNVTLGRIRENKNWLKLALEYLS